MKIKIPQWLIIFSISLIVVGVTLGCNLSGLPLNMGGQEPRPPAEVDTSTEPIAPAAAITIAVPIVEKPPNDTQRLQPEDLTYLGAFRLPADAPDEIGWAWSGNALAYFPGGDPEGANDGFPGSLFGTGHNWNTFVSEVDIPAPVVSSSLTDLPVANTLQPFADIRGDLFPPFEIPRVGLAYLPAEPPQESGKLYFVWADHAPGDDSDATPSLGWSETTLNNPQTAGIWAIGGHPKYVTSDYLLPIPRPWGDTYLSGAYLAAGRFRDGGQGAMGPSLFAVAPWQEGNPPEPGATIPATPLLLYDSILDENPHTLNDYSNADEWSGGAWLTDDDKSAAVFVGTKGMGETWYGCQDGTVWPDEPPYPPECPERGWWATNFEGQLLFYDPNDFAKVVSGAMEPWEPQPYAVMQLDDVLFHVDSSQQKHHLGAAAFDRENGLLYIMEPLADEDRSVVHVWRVGAMPAN